MTPIPKSHDELVKAADETRAKLLHTIVRLDRRGHEAKDASMRLGAFLKNVHLGRASLALAGTCMTVISVYEVIARSRRRPSRWRLF